MADGQDSPDLTPLRGEPLSGEVADTATGIVVDKPKTEEQTAVPVAGDVLNERFVLEREIGRGGMGIVYLARDLRKEEARDRHPHVAVKVLGTAFDGKPEAFIALQRECKKAQQLAHPNIATVYDFDRDRDQFYMTMELLVGESVEELLQRVQPGALDFKQAWPMIRDMAEGLAYAHEQGIVHSDFKPGNAFILRSGRVKVLDFGIARAVTRPGQGTADATVFKPGWTALTPAYASCEMFDDAPPDPRDDIYALACVAYEMLAGCHPFDKLPANQARSQAVVMPAVAGLSRRQNRALAHALAFDRNQRTASVSQFATELEGLNTGSGPVRAVWATALTATAVAAVFGYYWLKAPATEEPVASQLSPVQTAVDSETRASIDRILTMADLHLRIGRLTEPPGSNALEAYQAVLQLDPSNSRARAGVDRIAAQYIAQAQGQFEQQQFQPALLGVEQGLQWFPDDKELMHLKRRINEQMAR